MKTVEVKYQPRRIELSTFPLIEVTEELLRAEEVISARIMDDIDAKIAVNIGCLPPPYHQSHSFRVRMRHARTDLERSEAATLQMLLETFWIT